MNDEPEFEPLPEGVTEELVQSVEEIHLQLMNENPKYRALIESMVKDLPDPPPAIPPLN